MRQLVTYLSSMSASQAAASAVTLGSDPDRGGSGWRSVLRLVEEMARGTVVDLCVGINAESVVLQAP